MLTGALIGIQSVCIGISAYLTYKSTRKSVKLQLISKDKGFKHYRTGGF